MSFLTRRLPAGSVLSLVPKLPFRERLFRNSVSGRPRTLACHSFRGQGAKRSFAEGVPKREFGSQGKEFGGRRTEASPLSGIYYPGWCASSAGRYG